LTNNHSSKSTSAFAQAKERLDNVVIKIFISKNNSKNVIKKNAKAVAIDQSNSKSTTTSILTRENFNDATIEDASIKSKSKNTKSYNNEDLFNKEIAKSNIHINRTKINLRLKFKL